MLVLGYMCYMDASVFSAPGHRIKKNCHPRISQASPNLLPGLTYWLVLILRYRGDTHQISEPSHFPTINYSSFLNYDDRRLILLRGIYPHSGWMQLHATTQGVSTPLFPSTMLRLEHAWQVVEDPSQLISLALLEHQSIEGLRSIHVRKISDLTLLAYTHLL